MQCTPSAYAVKFKPQEAGHEVVKDPVRPDDLNRSHHRPVSGTVRLLKRGFRQFTALVWTQRCDRIVHYRESLMVPGQWTANSAPIGKDGQADKAREESYFIDQVSERCDCIDAMIRWRMWPIGHANRKCKHAKALDALIAKTAE